MIFRSVILDDFDRADGQAKLLETLEFFQRRVKLVIVTVNNKRNLEDALQRPGRIDEIVMIDKMDDEVIKHVLGEYVDGFDVVKDWPVSYVLEYVIRRRYSSAEEAATSLKELASRVADLNHYDDEENTDLARVVKMMEAAEKRKRKRPHAVQKALDDVGFSDLEESIANAEAGAIDGDFTGNWETVDES